MPFLALLVLAALASAAAVPVYVQDAAARVALAASSSRGWAVGMAIDGIVDMIIAEALSVGQHMDRDMDFFEAHALVYNYTNSSHCWNKNRSVLAQLPAQQL